MVRHRLCLLENTKEPVRPAPVSPAGRRRWEGVSPVGEPPFELAGRKDEARGPDLQVSIRGPGQLGRVVGALQLLQEAVEDAKRMGARDGYHDSRPVGRDVGL